MTKLQFDYCMKIEYSEEIKRCHFTIKCIPKTNARQQIDKIKIELTPDVSYNRGEDGFHNVQIYGPNDVPHTSFIFRITGEALTAMAEYEEVEDDNLTMVFKHPYGMNKPGTQIKEYFQKLVKELQIDAGEQKTNVDLAKEIMHCLHRDFSYKKNVTTVETGAEEAFALGKGVCQDYAHIFISLLHMCGMPARYVTGLIIGEGASHAWVEVWQDGKWYGLDPTNNLVVADEHIKIGVGRDANDCMINRGIMHGGGSHTQEIKVSVSKIETIV